MRLRAALPAILIFLAVLWVYWPSTDFSFQFDDALFLQDDNIRLGRWHTFVWPPQPRPLTWLSFLVQYQIHGPNPGPYHALNVLLHALCSLLVFAFLSRILESDEMQPSARIPIWPLLGALVFALHPLQSEPVLYIYQRSTLLAACFAFLTCLAYWSGQPRLTLVFLLLAIFSKEFTVILPVILWSMQGLLRGRWRPDRWLIIYSLAVLLMGLTSLIWHLPQDLDHTITYAATQVWVLWSYVRLTVLPIGLNVDHHIKAQENLLDPSWWLALGLLVSLLFLAFRVRNASPKSTFLAVLFFGFLLPTSSFIPTQDYMFEHRVYTSMAGFAGILIIVLSAGWKHLDTSSLPGIRQGYKVTVLAGFSSILITAFVVMDRGRLGDWVDEVVLWRDSAEKSPDKYRPNFNLGVSLMTDSPAEAVKYLSRAIVINPWIPEAHQSLGEVCFDLKNWDAAEQFWKRALSLNPTDGETHLALGRLYSEKRDFFQAHVHLQEAQALDPGDWRSYFHLARLNLSFGFTRQAILQSEMGLNRRPEHPGLRSLLADSFARNRNWRRAVQLYEKLLARGAHHSLILYKLASAYAATGNRDKAIAAAREGMAKARTEQERAQGELLLSRILSQIPDPLTP